MLWRLRSGTSTAMADSTSWLGTPATRAVLSTVTSPSGGTITGTVTFYDGNASIATLALANNQASYSTSYAQKGTHSISAVYPGVLNLAAGSTSNVVEEVVQQYPTTTTLSSSLNPSQYGQKVTFTAQVTSSGPTPTGKLLFRDGHKVIGRVTLSGGVAQVTREKLAVGTHPITAEYFGDANNAPSTSPQLYQVVQ